ncbi:MAG: hypothetical protein KW806_03280 [Candidatus Yanofskybacteria bacterium]|nr:hypothetical protein [Candidatus Yanofskybacteria bacterium]
MFLYPNSRKVAAQKILSRFPEARPQEVDLNTIDLKSAGHSQQVQQQLACHLLWMLEGISQMSFERSAKAGRWLGWVFAYMEVMGITTNEDSRNMSRVDAHNGND